jgi:DNA replication and repair protein RecF
MQITRLEVSGVRNISSLSISCNPGLNLFVGLNGAGKSAILEAIHLLGRGRSFRGASLEPVVRHGIECLRVAAVLEDELRGTVAARLVKHIDGRTELNLNGRGEKRLSEIARLMPMQLMLPDSSSLVFGGPEERRKYIDWGAFHVKPNYLDGLRAYQRALQQRNAALRVAKGRDSEVTKEAEVWTERIVELALAVDHARRDYLEILVPMVDAQMETLAPELQLRLSYLRGWPESSTLEDSLRQCRSRDVKLAATTCGPHRADLRLEIGSERASGMLSRGQAKVVASAMRLAQAQLTAGQGGRRSLFLIDDIGAELDYAHNEQFFQALERLGCQVFATAIVAPPLASAFAGSQRQLFHVEQGSCHPIDTEDR